MLELGAHMSVAGGHERAIDRALACAMTACQIFTKNANQWKAKPIDPEAAQRFRARWAESGMRGLVAHDSYLINIASSDDALWEKSRLAFREELDRCDLLGVPYLVTHPGAHLGTGVEAGVARVVEAIDQIHAERPDGQAVILIETTAGQGTTLGRTFEEVAAIVSGVADQSRIGVCLDTCHVFAAGYELRDEASYVATMTAFDQIVGLSRLKAIHLNDSKKGLGSHVDRHTHIGEGELGLEPFRLLLNDARLAGLPGILETPKGDDDADDKRNIATLRGLIGAPAAG
ncbi:MAG TPA: deoxyribonuclease IV [Thermomicrobiales bacterium]|nr:deoxyribonuclease IV [Thermomicrobiales bacterium]